jgi:glycosyltransferase involved in cell wall biosynthesis
VRFTGWRDDAPAIAAVADVAVLSSESEGRSVAVLEALAAGTPVVTTPAPGMRELVPPGAGIVTDDRSAASLAAAVSAVLDDPAAGARMGAAAARAAAALPVEPMIDAYERLYAASQDR